VITLAIDASTYTGDVSVQDASRILAEETVQMKGADHERLMPAVAAAVVRAGAFPRDIGRVVCGAGPGSFTSLRVAGAIAKGIASGVGCPLYAVPSMALVLAGESLNAGRYIVAIDALRGELYVGLYDVERGGAIVELEPARLVAAAEIDTLARQYEALIVSPSLPGTVFALPRARGVLKLESELRNRGPVSLDRWEPSYGRLAEAQVRWESNHGRQLPSG
jgi:tRNA threonylcarbamoyladenosine biosynthesis protein TsaB